MPNTTNFNWSTPADTDLVKNGASAIRTLGSAIDTSFVDLKGGTTGQVLKKTSATDLDFEWGTASSGLTLINTTSFSGVSSQSINDVFSTTYDNYRVLIKFLGSSSGDIRFRTRVSGTDASGANYATELIRGDGSTNNASSFTSETSALFGSYSTITGAIHMDMYSPFLAERTLFMSNSFYKSAGVPQIRIFNGEHDVATSYTGFTLLPNSGTITGTISVYGYNK